MSYLICGIDEVGLFVIYGLVDPITEELRYVGKSTQGLKRAKHHTKPSELTRHCRTHKACWLKTLVEGGHKPKVVLLATCKRAEDLYEKEQELITHFRSIGCPLTNLTDGGPGSLGYTPSDETREKIRRAVIAWQAENPTKHTEETKHQLRQLHAGRVHSSSSRENMAKGHGGRPFIEVATRRIFTTQSEAARVLQISQGHISDVLRGNRDQVNGFKFQYLETRCPT